MADAQVLGVMLSCATGLVTVGGALVVYSTRLAFLWEPQSLVLALGVATGGMLFFTLVDLVPEALVAFGQVVTDKMEADDGDDTDLKYVDEYASLILAAAFSLGALVAWTMDALCVRFAVPTTKRTRDQTVLTRMGTGSSSNSFATHSPTRATAVGTTSRRGPTLPLSSSDPDAATKELLHKMGTARVVAFAVQNIAEGFVLCLACEQRRSFGVVFACAIAMFNVTQGMALAGVLAETSGLRWRAVLWCVLAALGLPLGGFVAWALTLETTLSTFVHGLIYAVTSGLLVGTCLTQLLTVCYNHKSSSDSNRVASTVLSGVMCIASLRMLLAFVDV